MSTGSLRHFFATQSELLLFAMTLVTVRVEQRIAGIDFDPDIRRAIRQFTDQFVPLDQDRREEMQVLGGLCCCRPGRFGVDGGA